MSGREPKTVEAGSEDAGSDRAILKKYLDGVSGPGIDILEEGLDTPYGRLYRPLGHGGQILVLLGAFFGGPALAWVVAGVIGDLSEAARTLLYVVYVAVFFMGYAVWAARLNAIAVQGIGRSVLKTLFLLVVRRRRPSSLNDILPSRGKLLEMLVRAQKAGGSFAPVSWPIGLVAGLAASLFESAWAGSTPFVWVAASCVSWGHLLSYCGRRGWLPFMEEA